MLFALLITGCVNWSALCHLLPGSLKKKCNFFKAKCEMEFVRGLFWLIATYFLAIMRKNNVVDGF